jgi:hypothetical protein
MHSLFECVAPMQSGGFVWPLQIQPKKRPVVLSHPVIFSYLASSSRWQKRL